ncbi:MAG: HAD-IIB family hydrolase [Litoreibacter sp.]|nr:HAD-IIB family hydrolase [Litoreibacter sp.]
MSPGPEILIFSDLDGTLLDHETYQWRAAEPALARLRTMNAGLVLATSKTAAEVAPLRAEIGFSTWPAIVENGGGLLEPGNQPTQDTSIYQEIRAALRDLPQGFRGFGDMTNDEISALTGLSPQSAEHAKARQFSEPGLWIGAEADFQRFTDAAREAGLFVQRGGRFTALSFGETKADRVVDLIKRYRPKHSIALGDAPNDAEMLQWADIGIIVANRAGPDVPRLPGEDSGRIRRTEREGPDGWSDAVSEILDEFSTKREPTFHG